VITVPKPYPQGFRDDVLRVARTREADMILATRAAISSERS